RSRRGASEGARRAHATAENANRRRRRRHRHGGCRSAGRTRAPKGLSANGGGERFASAKPVGERCAQAQPRGRRGAFEKKGAARGPRDPAEGPGHSSLAARKTAPREKFTFAAKIAAPAFLSNRARSNSGTYTRQKERCCE